jgi:hypothetical protein
LAVYSAKMAEKLPLSFAETAVKLPFKVPKK